MNAFWRLLEEIEGDTMKPSLDGSVERIKSSLEVE